MSQSSEAFRAYRQAGWQIVTFPNGVKRPVTKDWNKLENIINNVVPDDVDCNLGLAHAYSGTMALDVDDYPEAVAELAKYGVDLSKLIDCDDAVIISSGRADRTKLIYKMPLGLILPTVKINIKVDDLQHCVFEFRCGTSTGLTVEDVLPPSIHPITRSPYVWIGKGDWFNLPVIPAELLACWLEILYPTEHKDQTAIHHIDPDLRQLNKITSAVDFINPDTCRQNWINVGMALHLYGSDNDVIDECFEIWNSWSAKSKTKYPGERVIAQQWYSFKSDKTSLVTINTIFKLAVDNGWIDDTDIDITGLFGNIGKNMVNPETLLQHLKPTPPNIDISLWPQVLADRALKVSNSIGCDVIVPLFAGLSAVCAVIDARTRLELVKGYRVPPILWLMTIGNPADKKSPGSRPMLEILKKLEIDDKPRFTRALLEWEGKEAAYAASKKAYLDFSASPDALMGWSNAPAVLDLPAQPVPLKLTVGDITSQKLVRHCAERPQGALCYLDEMRSWVKKLTDKSSGEDRSSWVISYEGEPYDMDRVGAGSIHCDNLAVSIYGNIQPRVLREYFNVLTCDGLLQRFIPGMLRENQTRLGNPLAENFTDDNKWEMMIRTIHALPESIYILSPDAYEQFRYFQIWYESLKHDERVLQSSDEFMTALGKIEGTTGRLILIFHLMTSPFDQVVNVEVVVNVINVVKRYIIPSLRYTLCELSDTVSFDAWLSEYIVQNCDKPRLSLVDLRRSARRQLIGKTAWESDQLIINAMQLLEMVNWVTRDKFEDVKGNRHSASWSINPKLQTEFADHRVEVLKARQRKMDEIYKSSPERKLVRGYDPSMGI